MTTSTAVSARPYASGSSRTAPTGSASPARAALSRSLSAARTMMAVVAAVAAATASSWRDPLAGDVVLLTLVVAGLVVGRELVRWTRGVAHRPDPPMVVVDAVLGLSLLVIVGDVAGPVGWVAISLPVLEALAVSGPLAAAFTWMAIGGSFVALQVVAGAAPEPVIAALVRHLGGSILVTVPAWAAGTVVGREIERLDEARRRAAGRSEVVQRLADSAVVLARPGEPDEVLDDIVELAVGLGFTGADLVLDREPAPLVDRRRGHLEHGTPRAGLLSPPDARVVATGPEHLQELHLAGLRAGWAVRIEGTGPGRGLILRVWRDTASPAGVDDASVLATFAGQARAALETARQRVALQERAAALAFDATHDPLTGVLNRAGLAEMLRREIDGLRGRAAVMFVDLDGFKAVNDRLGHDAGDAVLTSVAQRLSRRIGGSVVARVGGDEFVVVIGGISSPAIAEGIGERIVEMVCEPIDDARGTSLGASVGVALIGPDDSADEVMQRADHAMYVAKRGGGCRVVAVGAAEA